MLRVRFSFAVALALAVLGVASAPALAAKPTLFGVNLVKNGSAEAGPVSATGQTAVSIPNWQVVSGTGFTVVKYGTPGGFPTKGQAPPKAGKRFFSDGVGSGATCNEIDQVIPISGHGSLIDGGHVAVTASAWMATYSNQSDTAAVALYFDTAAGTAIRGMVLGSATRTNDEFIQVTESIPLSVGTRKLEVAIEAVGGHDGAYCDAYFDKISLKLTKI